VLGSTMLLTVLWTILWISRGDIQFKLMYRLLKHQNPGKVWSEKRHISESVK
jgi:hypothetical protein